MTPRSHLESIRLDMNFSHVLGLVEMGVVLLFGLGWAILELVGLHLDRKRNGESKETRDS